MGLQVFKGMNLHLVFLFFLFLCLSFSPAHKLKNNLYRAYLQYWCHFAQTVC